MSTPRPENRKRREWVRSGPLTWRVRIVLITLFALAAVTIWVSNVVLTERFTSATRDRAELRLALYSRNLLSELKANAIVPQLLALDPALIGALNSLDYANSTQRLISFKDEIAVASLQLLDMDGRVVATTERERLGEQHRNSPFFVDALRSPATIFSVIEREAGGYHFVYSQRVESGANTIGVILVELDLRKFERSWAGISDAILVTDSSGTIILSTESRWRGLSEGEALARETPQSAIESAIRATTDWTSMTPDAFLLGEAVMRMETGISFRGWRMVSFTTYASVRERVNGVLALEIMGFAILLSLVFYALSRRTAFRMALFQRESAELRALNSRLQREIAERERVQETLAVTEQTLEQSSKLAALGEMSAAVSHELNQPLAAMKTYLAGAQLLINRNRTDEALAAFKRIDGLIERMGAITRQLKSYARKGGDTFVPVNLNEALMSSLSMMEPQLRQRQIHITKVIPDEPVMVMGDRVRVEQVIINLLRNAIDATKSVPDPEIEILLAKGETARLAVRDNGHGIEDPDVLFEPFYTTKQPGDGVGLGLAISSGIVSDMGGRLTARNGQAGGAVFDVQLPIHDTARDAAE